VGVWADTFNYVEGKASQGYEKVVDLGSDAVLRVILKSSSQAPQGALRAEAQSETNSVLVLPLVIPARALFVQFDYTVAGDIKNDFLFFGLNDIAPVTFEGRFIPTNSGQASRPFEVIGLAGATNKFVFGLSGGTSKDCTVTIQAIRFILDDPSLSIGREDGQPVISWPADAANWELEMTGELPQVSGFRHRLRQLSRKTATALGQIPPLVTHGFIASDAISGALTAQPS
jgi:hypothetical protein